MDVFGSVNNFNLSLGSLKQSKPSRSRVWTTKSSQVEYQGDQERVKTELVQESPEIEN